MYFTPEIAIPFAMTAAGSFTLGLLFPKRLFFSKKEKQPLTNHTSRHKYPIIYKDQWEKIPAGCVEPDLVKGKVYRFDDGGPKKTPTGVATITCTNDGEDQWEVHLYNLIARDDDIAKGTCPDCSREYEIIGAATNCTFCSTLVTLDNPKNEQKAL